jgi:hypothetical protein
MEETLCELSFDKSCHTKVLKANSVFLSAYPGFIVFGRTHSKSYPAKSYFKFSPFELYKLYLAIIKVLIFFTEENPQETKGLILERCHKIVYFWTGIKVLKDGINEKIVTLGIEKQDDIIKIPITLSELHNFITALKSTIIICLCLNNLENEIIKVVSNLEINTFLKLKDYKETKMFVEKFLQENKYENQETFRLIELIHYYFDIILVTNKLTSMSNFENNVIKEILSAT